MTLKYARAWNTSSDTKIHAVLARAKKVYETSISQLVRLNDYSKNYNTDGNQNSSSQYELKIRLFQSILVPRTNLADWNERVYSGLAFSRFVNFSIWLKVGHVALREPMASPADVYYSIRKFVSALVRILPSCKTRNVNVLSRRVDVFSV